MIVLRLRVRNYRALRAVELDLGRLTYLVGRNGAGKSTVISALANFFRQIPSTVDDFSLGDTSRPIEIEVTFGDLAGAARTEFDKYVRADELTVVKRISALDGRTAEEYHGMVQRFPTFDAIRTETGRARIDTYRATKDRWDLPTATSGAAVDEALAAWEADHPDELELGEDDGSFFGFTNVGAGKISKYIDFVLVPAVRDATVDATDARDSTLRRLVDAVVRRSLNLDQALGEYRQAMADGYRAILARPQLSLDSLESRMTASIDRFAPGASVRLRWNEAAQPEVPSPAAIARLEDDGLEGDIASKGHGLQRAYVMAALQALAEVESERAAREEQAERGLLLAVEEPELYQHPAQARHIARTFASLAEGRGQVQILSCTHSPIFIDIRSFESIRVIRKRPDALTEAASASLDNSAFALDAAYAERGRYTGDGLRPGLRGLLNPYLSEAFFSDFVVLVEGEEDKAILESVLRRHAQWRQLTSRAFVVTPAGGKKNLDKLAVILAQLGVPFYMVFDRDGEEAEAAAGVERTNVALQRVVGETDPEGMPGTQATGRWAAFAPNLTQVVREEIGTTEWWTYRERACDESGIEARRNVEKNAEIVSRMLEMAEADGRSSPSIAACTEAIVQNFLQIYTQEPFVAGQHGR